MSLQMSRSQAIKDHDVRAIDISAIDRGPLGLSKFPDRFGEDGATLSFVHLDVALAVETQAADVEPSAVHGPRFRLSAKLLAGQPVESEQAPSTEAADPVMRRLSAALAAAEAAHDAHSAIMADALRLAILTRTFSRQTLRAPAELRPADAVREEDAGRAVRSLQNWRLKRVLQYVDKNLTAKITLQDLAAVAGLSRMHFAAQFRAATGVRPHEYLLRRRIERAQELLKQAEVALVDIALTVGFQTQAHFTTVFKRFVGDTPYQWRSAYLAQFMPLPRAKAGPS
ncbi:helix-turn-helix domain-containing protein [Bradyrhizobium symbiodeficiens]|uniref:helix-turn-helix domain-containing protein n=1 Tax=Bradyrhizobium symbiodeficiens TaxID=1404367 RepID=UPI00140F53B6|nr:AraC family transcriptional regulator [Bradyrhizobium symbiodeficiens]QIO99869.1 helix-turn-helix transcriptional regulator [Bradyrhizobium symbiodeficiens]